MFAFSPLPYSVFVPNGAYNGNVRQQWSALVQWNRIRAIPIWTWINSTIPKSMSHIDTFHYHHQMKMSIHDLRQWIIHKVDSRKNICIVHSHTQLDVMHWMEKYVEVKPTFRSKLVWNLWFTWWSSICSVLLLLFFVVY